jgi:hypothetical protein
MRGLARIGSLHRDRPVSAKSDELYPLPGFAPFLDRFDCAAAIERCPIATCEHVGITLTEIPQSPPCPSSRGALRRFRSVSGM